MMTLWEYFFGKKKAPCIEIIPKKCDENIYDELETYAPLSKYKQTPIASCINLKNNEGALYENVSAHYIHNSMETQL